MKIELKKKNEQELQEEIVKLITTNYILQQRIDKAIRECEEDIEEIERLQNVLNQIESALYNENLSNMYCRITIQDILDKENK